MGTERFVKNKAHHCHFQTYLKYSVKLGLQSLFLMIIQYIWFSKSVKHYGKKGYMTLNIGGGNTSFVKVNGSHLHRELKKEYRELEPAKTLAKLEKDHTKVPSPTCLKMISMFIPANVVLKLERTSAFKSV